MPIYDYLCSNCGERTEVIHGIAAPGPRFCPVCGAENTLRKAFAPPAVHFKGSGWAKKDRSTSSTKARSTADAGSDGAKPQSDSSGGESAPSKDAASSGTSGSTPAKSSGSAPPSDAAKS